MCQRRKEVTNRDVREGKEGTLRTLVIGRQGGQRRGAKNICNRDGRQGGQRRDTKNIGDRDVFVGKEGAERTQVTKDVRESGRARPGHQEHR